VDDRGVRVILGWGSFEDFWLKLEVGSGVFMGKKGV
jgi:hypothetical protein